MSKVILEGVVKVRVEVRTPGGFPVLIREKEVSVSEFRLLHNHIYDKKGIDNFLDGIRDTISAQDEKESLL